MVRRMPILIVASLVLLAAGVAAANSLLIGPSPGLTVGAGSTVAQSTPATTSPSPVGPSTGTPTTNGLGTTEPSTGAPGTTTDTAATAPNGTLTIDRVVSITRSVAPGTPVTVFTVPAGRQLVITDMLVTNGETFPACGAAVNPATPPAASPELAGTSATGETGTGLLCVPAQTSLDIGLTTGLEFDGGQSVVLANASATEGATTPATLHYHLRGFLMSSGGT